MNIESCRNSRKHQSGFTAIEVVAVILIIAIVGVIAVSRFTAATSYSVATEAETMKANLRYAQFRALSDADTTYTVNNATWGISFSGNSYTLQKNRINATTIFPGENSPTHNLPGGISITAGGGTTVTYDVWGRPIDTSGNPLTSNIMITISDGFSPQTITVTQNTGFIP
jgi:prepilin-type N-terminal cleavage/methylation domain-containing protein